MVELTTHPLSFPKWWNPRSQQRTFASLGHPYPVRSELLTITPGHAVQVSRLLRDEFDNGKEYYAIHGKEILIPDTPAFRPPPEQLHWHNEHVYRA
jgi:hypothetical protein